MRTCIFLAAAALAAPPVLAEWGERHSVSYRRAEYRDDAKDRGKYTIEVEVDGAAEIEIRGDTARLRTIGGQSAAWRRFQCNAPLPSNPVEFRFRGIDGRGQQSLLREPWGGRGAVVLIEDPKRGREGYTFDIEWRGARRRT